MADPKPFKDFMKELKKKVDGYFLFTPAADDNATVEFSKKKPKPVGDQIFGTVQLDEERVYITGKKLTDSNLRLIRKAFKTAAIKEVFLTPEEAEALGIGDRVKPVVDGGEGDADDDADDKTGGGKGGAGSGGSSGGSGSGSSGAGSGAAGTGGGTGDGGGRGGNDRGGGRDDGPKNETDRTLANLENRVKKALALWPNLLRAMAKHRPPPDIVAAAKRINAILRPKGSALSASDLIDHYDFDAEARLTEALGLLQTVARFVTQAENDDDGDDNDDDDDGLAAFRKGRDDPAGKDRRDADDDEGTTSDMRKAVEASLASAATPPGTAASASASASAPSSSAARAPAADDDDDVDDKAPASTAQPAPAGAGQPQPDPALVASFDGLTRIWPGIVAALTGPAANPADLASVTKIDPVLREGGKILSPAAFFAKHGANAAKILALIGQTVFKLRQRAMDLQLQAEHGDGGGAQPSSGNAASASATSGSAATAAPAASLYAAAPAPPDQAVLTDLTRRLVKIVPKWPSLYDYLERTDPDAGLRAKMDQLDGILRAGGRNETAPEIVRRLGANAPAQVDAALRLFASLEAMRADDPVAKPAPAVGSDYAELTLGPESDYGDLEKIGDAAAQAAGSSPAGGEYESVSHLLPPEDESATGEDSRSDGVPDGASASAGPVPGGQYGRVPGKDGAQAAPAPPGDHYHKAPPPAQPESADGDYGALPEFKNDDQLWPQRRERARELQTAWNRDVAGVLAQLVQTGTAPKDAVERMAKEFSQLLEHGGMSGGKMAQLDRAQSILETFVKLVRVMERTQKAEMDRKLAAVKAGGKPS